MAHANRHLWPTSESRYLQREYDSNKSVPWAAPTYSNSDVLVPGSDDELDERAKFAKRRRIVLMGEAYLSGRPLYIASASLKGPFGKAHAVKDKVIWKEYKADKVERKTRKLHVRDVDRKGPDTFAVKMKKALVDDSTSIEKPALVLKRRPIKQRPEMLEEGPSCSPTTTMQDLRRERELVDGRYTRVRKPKRVLDRTTSDQTGKQHTQGRNVSGNSSSKENSDPTSDALVDTNTGGDEFATAQEKPSESNGADDEDTPRAGTPNTSATSSQKTAPYKDTSRSPTSVSVSVQDRFQSPAVSSHDLSEHFGLSQAKQLSRRAVEPAKTNERDRTPALDVSLPHGFTAINTGNDKLPVPKVTIDIQPEADHEKRTDDRSTLVQHLAQARKRSRKNLKSHTTSKSTEEFVRETTMQSIPVQVYDKTTDDKSSPFLFRKPKILSNRNSAVREQDDVSKVVEPAVRDGSTSPHHEDLDRTPATSTPVIPALDVTFGDNSLGMNELLAQYTNSRLPAPTSTEQRHDSVKRHLRKVMTESGASLHRQPDDIASSVVDAQSPIRTNADLSLESPAASEARKSLAQSPPPQIMVDIEPDPIHASPELSTQAALHNAHLDLITATTPDSRSPQRIRPHGDVTDVDDANPGGFTPFAEFNRKISVDHPDNIEPIASTQAIFDAFSPFAFSTVKKPRVKKRASFMPVEIDAKILESAEGNQQHASDTMAEGEEVVYNETDMIPPPDKVGDGTGVAESTWSFAAIDENVIIPPATVDDPIVSQSSSKPGPMKKALMPRIRDHSEDTQSKISTQFKVSQQKSRPSLSEKSRSLSQAQRESSEPIQSFSLSQIISSVQENRVKNIDVNRLLGLEQLRSSQRSKSSSEKRKRGKVLDWDAASVNSLLLAPDEAPGPSLVPDSMAMQDLPMPGIGSGSTIADPIDDIEFGSRHSDSQTKSNGIVPTLSQPPSTARSMAPPTTFRSSFGQAQREPSVDIDATIDDLQSSVLTSWDVEKAMRQEV